MKRSLAASVAVIAALALALFTGAAFAGGHGGGRSGDPGNAGGHSEDGGASARQSQMGRPPAWSQQQQQSSQQVQTGGDNAQGVEPSSTTSHETYATAGSGHTKRYGNGTTAGRIVEQRGAPPSTVLHGPGNSQPHKVVSCAGGHEADVHAYKGGSACGGSGQTHVAPARREVENVQKPVVHVEKQKPVAHVQVEHVQTHVERTSVETGKAEVHAASTEQGTHYAAHEKVYICHATGSATNPYVLIHVSKNALSAHTRHQGGRDIVLGDTLPAGSGCPSGAATAASSPSGEAPTPTCTTQEQVQVAAGVEHSVGPKGSGRYVVVHPSAKSAHYENKHPDEIVSESRTIDVAAPCTQAPAVQPGTPSGNSAVKSGSQEQAQTSTSGAARARSRAQTPAPPQAPTAAASTGGAAGVQATVRTQPAAAAKPATHGVLGAQATLRPQTRNGGVLGTVRSTTLPFTGLPLWPAVLGGLALIGAGAAVRRAQRGQP